MKDVRIDSNGDMRCWNCGSRGFAEKRTFRSKAMGAAGGVVTLGVAAAATPLLTKKKLRCQACGKYNDVGSAKAWEEESAPTASQPVQVVSNKPAPRPVLESAAEPDKPTYRAHDIDPVVATGWRGQVTFDGTTVSIDKKFGAPRHREHRITEVTEVQLLDLGKGGKDGVGIVFVTPDVKPPKPKFTDVHVHDAGITFEPSQRAEAEAFLAVIEAQRVTEGDEEQ